MNEYVRTEVKAWKQVKDTDKEMIEHLLSLADDITELPKEYKKKIISIFKDNEYVDIEPDDNEEDKLAVIDYILGINHKLFERNDIKADEDMKWLINKYGELAKPKKTNTNNNKYEDKRKDNDKRIMEIQNIVKPFKTIDYNAVINNEYNIRDINDVITRLNDAKNGAGPKVRTEANKHIMMLEALKEAIPQIQKYAAEVEQTAKEHPDWSLKDILGEAGVPTLHDFDRDITADLGTKDKMFKLSFYTSKHKNDTYNEYLNKITDITRSTLNNHINELLDRDKPKYTPTQREILIDRFNSLDQQYKNRLIEFIPTYNTQTKAISGKGITDLRPIFKQILGVKDRPNKDDINEVIKVIGDYIYGQSTYNAALPGLEDELNKSIDKEVGNMVSNMFNKSLLNSFVPPHANISTDDIVNTANDFDDGFEFEQPNLPLAEPMAESAAQNEDNNIYNIDEEEQEEEQEEETENDDNIKDADDVVDNIIEQPILQQNQPTDTSAETMAESAAQNEKEEQDNDIDKSLIPIKNNDVPAVITSVVGAWFDKDKTLADVLDNTVKVITLLTDEQYNKIEDQIADQLIMTVDDGGNKLFNDKAQVVKFLRSIRSKKANKYKLPQQLQRIDNKNNNLMNKSLSALTLRNIKPMTRSYKFYNE